MRRKGVMPGGAMEPALQSVWAIKQRRHLRQLYPFFFRMGPVALCITSVLLIGLMAVLYLSQVGQAVSDNQSLQNMRTQEATLQRQNQDLVNIVAQEQSPATIAENAKKAGLQPADAKNVQVVQAPDLKPVAQPDEKLQP